MLVRELISHMHCTQVANISILESKKKVYTLFEKDTKGNPKSIEIPEDLLNREVEYYTIDPLIVTTERVSNEYIILPYIKLKLNFVIMLKEEMSKNESKSTRI